MKKFTGFMKYIISGTGVTFMITTLLLWGAAAFLRNKDGMNAVSFRSDTFAAILCLKKEMIQYIVSEYYTFK